MSDPLTQTSHSKHLLHRLLLRGIRQFSFAARPSSTAGSRRHPGEFRVLRAERCLQGTVVAIHPVLIRARCGQSESKSNMGTIAAGVERDVSSCSGDRLYHPWEPSARTCESHFAIPHPDIDRGMTSSTDRLGMAGLLDDVPEPNQWETPTRRTAKALLTKPSIFLAREPLRDRYTGSARRPGCNCFANTRVMWPFTSATATFNVTHDGDEAMRWAERGDSRGDSANGGCGNCGTTRRRYADRRFVARVWRTTSARSARRRRAEFQHFGDGSVAVRRGCRMLRGGSLSFAIPRLQLITGYELLVRLRPTRRFSHLR